MFFFVFTMLFFSVNVGAYIDPSAMTFLIQVVAGVVIAAGAACGYYFRKVRRAGSAKRKTVRRTKTTRKTRTKTNRTEADGVKPRLGVCMLPGMPIFSSTILKADRGISGRYLTVA